MHMCISVRQRPDRLIRVLRIIIIVVVAAVAARWDPPVAVPLIAGLGLGGWLLAGSPAPAAAR